MITSAQLDQAFKLFIDEFQTDNFLESERSLFLSSAQMFLFKQFVHPDVSKNPTQEPGHNAYFESNHKLSEYVSPFKRSFLNQSTAADAKVLFSTLDSVDPTRTVYIFMDAEVQCPAAQKFFPAKYKSRTEALKQLMMDMYKPDCCNPWITVETDHYQLYPNDIDELDYNLYYLVLPEDIDLTSGVGSEFDYALKDAIVWKAIEIAATSIREEKMAMKALNMYIQSGV